MTQDTAITVYGYVRISGAENQRRTGLSLEHQRAAIAAECDRRGYTLAAIYEDVASGKSTRKRPGLAEAIAACESSHATLMAVRVDRLSRSVFDFANLLQQASVRSFNVAVLDLGIALDSPMGKAMAQMAGVFAELERSLIGERTREALAAARKRGVRLGAPRSIPEPLRADIRRLYADGASQAAVARALGQHRTTVRRVLAA